jgi:hypothetical protein
MGALNQVEIGKAVAIEDEIAATWDSGDAIDGKADPL